MRLAAARIAASIDDVFGMVTWWGKNSTVLLVRSALVEGT